MTKFEKKQINMRTVLTLFFVALSVSLFAQNKEVTLTEGMYSFSVGSKNAITITVPDSKMEVVSKSLKKEIKSWGGKMKSSKTEITTLQSSDKKLLDGKAFDTYTKIYQDGQDVKISIAVDLGGAYLSSADYPEKFNQFKQRLYMFAVTAGTASVAADSKAEEKILKGLQKELKSFEKNDQNYKKNIEKMKAEIQKNETSINENNVNIERKKAEITTQENKIIEIKKTVVN